MKDIKEKHLFVVIAFTVFLIVILFIDSFQHIFCNLFDPFITPIVEFTIRSFNLPAYYLGCYYELSNYSLLTKIIVVIGGPILLLWMMSWKIKKGKDIQKSEIK